MQEEENTTPDPWEADPESWRGEPEPGPQQRPDYLMYRELAAREQDDAAVVDAFLRELDAGPPDDAAIVEAFLRTLDGYRP